MFRLDPIQLRRLARGHSPLPARVVRILSSRGQLLSALLLANTAVNVGFATIMTSVLLGTSRPSVSRYMVQTLSTVVSTVLILFWGEILPKTFATRRPAALAARFAVPASFMARFLRPLTWVADGLADSVIRVINARGAHSVAQGAAPAITPETIEAAVDIGAEQGMLPTEDQRMIHSALETVETTVRQVMTPRPYIVWLPDTAPVAHVLTVALRTGHSRIPLYGPGADTVTGVVHVKDLLPCVLSRNLRAPAAGMAKQPYFVPDVKPVSDLLSDMRRLDVHMAMALDEHGGIAGLVTMEDVVEEIVGEIADEFDGHEPPAMTADGGHVLAARTTLEDAERVVGQPLPRPAGVSTLGGLVYALAGRVPAQGEIFAAPPWRLTVHEMRGTRILKVKVNRT